MKMSQSHFMKTTQGVKAYFSDIAEMSETTRKTISHKIKKQNQKSERDQGTTKETMGKYELNLHTEEN